MHFSGKVREWSVQVRARVYGDVLDFYPESGHSFLRGRMLLHEKGDRLMTRFVFPDKESDSRTIVPLHLFRSN